MNRPPFQQYPLNCLKFFDRIPACDIVLHRRIGCRDTARGKDETIAPGHVNAGMDAETAFDTVFWYKRQGNDSGLERYICEIERGQRQRPNDG